MRILNVLAAASLLVFTPGCGGADAPAAEAGATAQAQATPEEVRALVKQFGEGGGEKDVAGERFYDLAQRAVPGLVAVIGDRATPAYDLETILFIANVYVPDPAVYQALRTRIQSLPDRTERQELTRMMNALSGGPSLPYPR